MSEHGYAVILAGGRGERFWPLSRARRPKQLLSLVGERSLLAQAVERLQGLIPPDRILIITNADLVEASRAAVPEVPAAHVIGEPVGRDTAAAVALGAALVKARDPAGVFAVLTADHVIGDLPLFRATIEEAMAWAAAKPDLLTIGLAPREPSTAYGYIEREDLLATRREVRLFKAVRFVEKPRREVAEEYLRSGRYLWNSGMFIWSVAAIQAAFRAHRPALAALVDTLSAAAGTRDFDACLAASYAGLEKISIDYAVMEKARNIVVAEGRFAWDDVGSWTALENHFPADGAGNVVVGEGVSFAARHNIIYSRDRLTALVGVDDLIVVQAEGVTLVCRRERAQDIKQLLEQIRAEQRNEVL